MRPGKDSTYHQFLKKGIVLESPEESQAWVSAQHWHDHRRAMEVERQQYWGSPAGQAMLYKFGEIPQGDEQWQAEQAAYWGSPTAASSSSAPASASSSALWE